MAALLVLLASCGSSEAVQVGLPPAPTALVAAATAVPAAPTAVPAAEPTPPAPTPPPTTLPTLPPAEPVCDGPPRDQRLRLEVIDVAPDDIDGGLVVHTMAGAATPIVGVLPWDASGIVYTSSGCERLPSGAEWWLISAGDLDGWVNSRYLGDRTVRADSFDARPCAALPEPGPEPDNNDAVVGTIAITDIDVVSSRDCDRVVVTLGQGWNFSQSIPRSIPTFPTEIVRQTRTTPSELELSFTGEVASAIDSVWYTEDWRDVATNEQNVALAYDRDGSTALYVGWGTGDATVHFLDAPARIVIDIVQKATEEGQLAGPIVGPAVLFDPIQTDLEGPGVTLPIVIRGYSRGFESSSLVWLADWDQTEASHPFNWGFELFGAAGTAAERVVFDDADREVPFPFTTAGYFDFVITDLAPGGYQLAVSPTSGCRAPLATGQQFRVAEPGPAEGFVPATTFALNFDLQRLPKEEFVVTAGEEERRIATEPVAC